VVPVKADQSASRCNKVWSLCLTLSLESFAEWGGYLTVVLSFGRILVIKAILVVVAFYTGYPVHEATLDPTANGKARRSNRRDISFSCRFRLALSLAISSSLMRYWRPELDLLFCSIAWLSRILRAVRRVQDSRYKDVESFRRPQKAWFIHF
jgi:hypothetical protein